jgi:hypothetical protein
MTEHDLWMIDSEAAGRFYRAVIALEDIVMWIRQTRFRYIHWKKRRWFKELPPLVHAGVVWGESVDGSSGKGWAFPLRGRVPADSASATVAVRRLRLLRPANARRMA